MLKNVLNGNFGKTWNKESPLEIECVNKFKSEIKPGHVWTLKENHKENKPKSPWHLLSWFTYFKPKIMLCMLNSKSHASHE